MHCYDDPVATLEEPTTVVSLTERAASKIKELQAQEPVTLALEDRRHREPSGSQMLTRSVYLRRRAPCNVTSNE